MSGEVEDGIHRWARLSACKQYRYQLGRSWSDGDRMLYVMLNPSTADHLKDDPTIRRCMSFAQREGCGSLEVVNLYAWRATKPKEMAGKFIDDLIGGNEATDATLDAISRASIVVAAWGANKLVPPGRNAFERLIFDHAPTTRLHHLGDLTKDAQPRHPLYLSSDAPLRFWQGAWGRGA